MQKSLWRGGYRGKNRTGCRHFREASADTSAQKVSAAQTSRRRRQRWRWCRHSSPATPAHVPPPVPPSSSSSSSNSSNRFSSGPGHGPGKSHSRKDTGRSQTPRQRRMQPYRDRYAQVHLQRPRRKGQQMNETFPEYLFWVSLNLLFQITINVCRQ